jgi:hypothetical protein
MEEAELHFLFHHGSGDNQNQIYYDLEKQSNVMFHVAEHSTIY